MTTAGHAAPARRRIRLWVATLASAALVAGPLLAIAPAHAATAPFIGDGAEGWTDSSLSAMVEGEVYSDQLAGPNYLGDFYLSYWEVSGLPPGLQVTPSDSETSSDYLVFSGSPTTAGDYTITITIRDDANESSSTATFEVTVETGKNPTTTTVTAPPVAPYDAIPLVADVAGAAAGNVQFAIDGIDVGSPQAIDEIGHVEYTASTSSSAAGTTVAVTAHYLGDEVNAASVSTSKNVFIYSSTTTAGTVWQNGAPVSGAVVDLLEMPVTESSVPRLTSTTGDDGRYLLQFLASDIATQAAAEKTYLIRATLPGGAIRYYSSLGGPGKRNVSSPEIAEDTGPVTWSSASSTQDIFNNIPPVWTDNAIAVPRQGSAYADQVTASGTGPIDYSLGVYDELPPGLSLNATTGAITGVPSCATEGADPCFFEFTIVAADPYGSVTQTFAFTLLPAGVPPAWTADSAEDLGSLQVGIAYSGGVEAEGDAVIVYEVTSGELPSGLTLNADTGVISGTPTSDGDYSVTVMARNAYGFVDQLLEGTVAASPTIDLKLNFQAGTSVGDADTTISADGLKVGSEYTLVMHSTPVTLYTGIIGPTGGFTWTVALPADTPVGAHKLILTGIAPDGRTMTATAWFTLRADGTIGAISYTGPVALAFTGGDLAPLGLPAAVFLLLGLALVTSRRRRASA